MKIETLVTLKPNHLSALRVVFTIPLLFTFRVDHLASLLLSSMLMIILATTDFLDGWTARSRGLETDAGELIDSMADGFARLTIFVLFAINEVAPGWMVVIIMWRDFLSWSLKFIGLAYGLTLRKRLSGKLLGLVQSIAICLTMSTLIWSANATSQVSRFTHVFVLAATISALVSIIDLSIVHRKYVVKFLNEP